MIYQITFIGQTMLWPEYLQDITQQMGQLKQPCNFANTLGNLKHRHKTNFHSQNHRLLDIGRDLEGSSGPTSPLKHGQLKLRTISWWIWNISKEEDFLGKLWPCSVTLTVEKCLLMLWGNLLCLSLCLWHWEESVHLAPSLPVALYFEKVP